MTHWASLGLGSPAGEHQFSQHTNHPRLDTLCMYPEHSPHHPAITISTVNLIWLRLGDKLYLISLQFPVGERGGSGGVRDKSVASNATRFFSSSRYGKDLDVYARSLHRIDLLLVSTILQQMSMVCATCSRE